MANTTNWFKSKIDSLKNDFDFRLEKLILDVTENIVNRMTRKKLSRVNLADKLEISPPAVTKILDGNSNFTLKTLLSLADALELKLNIDFTDKVGTEQAPTIAPSNYTSPSAIEPSGLANTLTNAGSNTFITIKNPSSTEKAA